MSTIVLNSLNYVGNGVLNGISQFIERSLAVVSGFSNLTARISFNPTKTVVAWKLTVPVIGGEASACACPGDVLRGTIVDISVRFDRGATSTERADVLTRVRDLVATSQFGDSISSLTQPS